MGFKNKIAIITGGSEGIGFGIASALANKGTKVYLVARDKDKLETAKRSIKNQGGNAEFYQGDITKINDIEKIVNEVHKKNKRLDIFVNNAGAWRKQTIGEDRESLRNMRALARDAPTDIAEYLVHKFRNTENQLQILTVISQAGLRFMPNNLGYGTGKMGLTINLLHIQEEMKINNIRNIKLYTIYPATAATPNVIPLIKSGKLQDATTLESVVDTAIELISDKTETRHAYIGYIPGQGIVRKYFELGFDCLLPQKGKTVIVDANFNPKKAFE